jgi:2'-5' RNA ligase
LKFIAALLFLALSIGTQACQSANAPEENSGLQSERDAKLKADLDTAPFTLSGKVHSPVMFVENASYLAMNISYKPIERLKQAVSSRTGSKLKNRGEAHITVLTPSEFSAIAKVLDKKEINELAVAGNIQAIEFSALCLGSGSISKDGKIERSYFVVVESPGLIALRQSLLKSFENKARSAAPFEAEHYYPHITIGFTKSDLHEEQGVIKDAKSCVGALEEIH